MKTITHLQERAGCSRRQLLVTGTFCLFCATMGSVAACIPKKRSTTPDTSVARGELFETGSPIYDEYFATVHELHAAVATARLEERDARTTLATMLQLLPTAEPEQILRKLREKAATLPRMRMVIEADQERAAQVTLLDDDIKPDESTRGLMLVIEATANASLSISKRMAEIPERAHRMHNVGVTLSEGAANDFAERPRSERDRIALELKGALGVLRDIANESRAVAATSRVFAQDIQTALHESLGAQQTAADQEPQAKPTRSSAPPAGGTNKPPPPQKPAPPAVDFNP